MVSVSETSDSPAGWLRVAEPVGRVFYPLRVAGHALRVCDYGGPGRAASNRANASWRTHRRYPSEFNKAHSRKQAEKQQLHLAENSGYYCR
jgi:hypothetical protein